MELCGSVRERVNFLDLKLSSFDLLRILESLIQCTFIQMNKELGHDVLLVFPGDGRVSGKVSTFPQFSNKDTLQLVDVEHKANGLRAPSLCERWCISVCVSMCVCVCVFLCHSVCL